MTSLNPETLLKFLPAELTEPRKRALAFALQALPANQPYYAEIKDDDPLQGDGWAGFQVFNFDTGERGAIKGIVLTNSCDMASDNKRMVPPSLTFTPLVVLKNYLNILVAKGATQQRVDQLAVEIRAQNINSLFYLPASPGRFDEHIALLSDAHSMPLMAFMQDAKRARMFNLSDVGFYTFLFKLSVHFCRFHEDIDRSVAA